MKGKTRNALLDYVQKTRLIKVLNNLNYVGMIELFQHLNLLKTTQKITIFTCIYNLADAFDTTFPVQHFADDSSAAPYDFGEMVDFVRISSMPINDALCPQFDVFFC